MAINPPVSVLLLAAGIAVAASGAGAQYPSVPPPPPCHDASAATRRVISRPAARSLGVVVFQNTAKEPSDVFLGPAVGTWVVENLRANGSLSVVVSRRFGFETAASQAGAKTIGSHLGVRYVLTAQVGRTEAGEVSIAAQVRRSSDGAAVWNLNRSVTSGQLPAVVGEVSGSVADVVINGQPTTRPATVRLADWSGVSTPEAIAHFLRGNYYSTLNTLPDYEAALAQFDSSTRSDPGIAASFASSALTIATMLEWGWWDYGESRVRELTERGLAAADRALQLDSTMVDAWVARGALLSFRNPRSFAGASKAYARALSYAPRDPRAHHWYGRSLMQMGEHSSARRELKKALQFAPGDAGVLVDLARLDRHEGRSSEACIMLDSAIASDPTAAQAYVVRALTRAQRGEVRFAWADAETGGRLGWPFWGRAASAAIDARARDTSSARERSKALRTAVAASGNYPTAWTSEYLAIALAASGESERALDLLERAQYGGARLWFAMTGPDFKLLEKNRRFRTLLAASHPRR